MMTVYKKIKKNPLKTKNEKAGKLASIGATGFTTLGITAHNFCHYLCLGIIAALGIFGIASAGMPLMWLENYAIYFWAMGLIFLGVSFYLLYMRPNCISKNAIMANTGLLVIAIPANFGALNYGFWTAGGLLVATSVYLYLKSKFANAKIGGKK